MNTEVNFHPAKEHLRDFALGTLSGGMSVATSAHVELCQSCKSQVKEFETEAGNDWNDDALDFDAENFSGMIDEIVNQAQQIEEKESLPMVKELHLNEHVISLPGVLAKAASHGLRWKKLGGGISQASLALDNETHCEFIYMSPGSKTPVHKHQGNEITLVLDGSFKDELGSYQAADFLLRTAEDVHQPQSEEGCLCFAVTDSPLKFTRGFARLLNPLNNYRFRKAIANR